MKEIKSKYGIQMTKCETKGQSTMIIIRFFYEHTLVFPVRSSKPKPKHDCIFTFLGCGAREHWKAQSQKKRKLNKVLLIDDVFSEILLYAINISIFVRQHPFVVKYGSFRKAA